MSDIKKPLVAIAISLFIPPLIPFAVSWLSVVVAYRTWWMK